MYDDKVDRYNYISIIFFLLPIISSIYHKCELFLLLNCIVLTTGFSYHMVLKIYKKTTPLINFLRLLDIFAVHSVISYIFYYSVYSNLYTILSVILVSGILVFYYKFSEIYYHSYIHILGSIAMLCSINSCQINLKNCHMC